MSIFDYCISAFFPTAGQAHFDMEEKWSLKDRNGFNNLVQVATHEVGHMLGLGHSSISGSIMSAWYNSPSVKNSKERNESRDFAKKYKGQVKLSWDDIRAIQDLYDGPKDDRSNKNQKNMNGDYSAAITISPTRILVSHFLNLSTHAFVEVLSYFLVNPGRQLGNSAARWRNDSKAPS